MRKEKIIINEKEYEIYLRFESREGSRVSIGKNGIYIRVPVGRPREEQCKEILRLKRWAMEKIKEKPPEFKHKGSRIYNDGDKLNVANEEFILRLSSSEKQSSSAKIRGDTFYINVSSILPDTLQQKHISVLLSRLVAKKKKGYIEQKIHHLNEKHFNFKFQKVFLKYNTSNWGSCSHSDNVNISTRLLFAPDEVIDYVCIHELAHLKERNHSPEFWKLVEGALPDYRKKEKWLKENSDQCWF